MHNHYAQRAIDKVDENRDNDPNDQYAHEHATLMRNIIVMITKYTTCAQASNKKNIQAVNEEVKQILFSLFKLYIDNESQNISIPLTMQNVLE